MSNTAITQAGMFGIGPGVGQTINSHWTNISDNITSLKVVALVSNAIGVGSYIELWRLSS